MSGSSIGNKRQLRGATQYTRGHAVKEAKDAEDEEQIVAPNHDPKPNASPTRREDPLDQEGKHQKDVENDGLHGIEPHIMA